MIRGRAFTLLFSIEQYDFHWLNQNRSEKKMRKVQPKWKRMKKLMDHLAMMINNH